MWNFFGYFGLIMEEDDMSWLTQVPSLEQGLANCDIGGQFYEEECGEIVSLEDLIEGKGTQVLYDNMVCEDISSDEELENL